MMLLWILFLYAGLVISDRAYHLEKQNPIYPVVWACCLTALIVSIISLVSP